MFKQIKDDLYWIGVLDKELAVFDVIMETKYGTSYNSYLIKTTNHNILIETVKNKYTEEFINNINELVGGVDNIHYVVVNHTEPDHAGSLEYLLDINPNIEVIGSKAAISYLGDITNKQFKNHVIKHNEEFKVDNKTLKFILAPFLHWPDSMYTYLIEDNALFTCDSFGSHYSSDNILLSKLDNSEEESYQDSLRYYYDAIFSPYKKFVLQALDKIKGLDINYICTGHGPVIDENVKWYLKTYEEWSTDPIKDNKLVLMPYASSYGYTETMAQLIAKGIKAVDNSIEVKIYNLNVRNYPTLERKIVGEMYNADAILFGSTTINKDATNVIWDMVNNLNPIVHAGKYTSVFGSYGWSGEGVDNIQIRLKTTGLKVLPSIKLKFKPAIEDEETLIEYGKSVASAILNKGNDINLICNNKITMKVSG